MPLAPEVTPLYVGIDLGTSACRIFAIDAVGEVHARASAELPAPLREGSAVEQSPQLWWDATCAAWANLGTQISTARVVAIAVDGTSGTVLLTNRDGKPLGPALMYSDARAVMEAAQIAGIAPATSAAHGTGGSLAKLLWLQARACPAAAHVLSQADWISAKLCGRYGISDENNCLKMGYDPARRLWPAWLDALGVQRRLLPEAVVPGTLLGRVTTSLATQFQLACTTAVIAGTTDSTAAFLAAGAGHSGEAVTMLGSTLVLKLVCEQPVFAPEYGIYSHRIGDVWLVGGGSNSGGAVLRHYFSAAALTAMTPRLRVDQPTGLDYYPLLHPGERFPVNDPLLPPRLAPRPADDLLFFQGMLEGITRIEQTGYALLARLGAGYPVRVHTTGGGALNNAWRHLRQQVLGIPVVVAQQTEAAYGAALLALRGHPVPSPSMTTNAL